ncbi:MAG TPA: hypothetical protein VHC49_13230 [Mycobacteriales bacterium]|nr:hypothetical protein [Mycobacteriales bacterium]
MVLLKRLVGMALLSLGVAILVILARPATASACGEVNYQDGDVSNSLNCPTGPDDTGIGLVGGGFALGGGGLVVYHFNQGSKATGNPQKQPKRGSGKPKPKPDPYRTGPQDQNPNPYRLPRRDRIPRVGDPLTLKEAGENPAEQTEGALDLAGNLEQSTAGTLQQAASVGLPPPPPNWSGGDMFAQGADPVSYLVQLTVALALGIRARIRGVG